MGLAWPFLAQVRVETKYSGYRLFGLTTSDIGGGFCPTRYGLELVHGGALEIYENCLRVAYPPALVYGAGDQLRIEADAGVVRYKRQVAGSGTWQVMYTSTLPVTAALYFNASLYTPGSTLKEIRFVIGSTAAPSVNRTYYTFGGARVAMRDGAGTALVYLHGDQLGSASLATTMTGTVLSQQRYAPYGEVRWASGAGMPTDFTFTSQRAGPAGYVGSLTDYVARFYSPALGRFISADTIVPGAGNPQAFNRYMYVLGRPLGQRDPDGHRPTDDGEQPCPPSLQGCGGSSDDASIVRTAAGMSESEEGGETAGQISTGQGDGADPVVSLRGLNPYSPGGTAYQRADKLLGLADKIPGATKLFGDLTRNGRFTPRGAAFQTDRALAAADKGKLVAIQPKIDFADGTKGYPDHLETGDVLVDAKSWSETNWKAMETRLQAQEVDQFASQMRKYLSPDVNGKLYNVRVEFKEFIPDQLQPIIHKIWGENPGRIEWIVTGY